MKLTFTAAVVAVALGFANASPAELAERATSTACNNYKLVTVRGTYIPQNLSLGYEGMLSQTMAAVSGGRVHDLIYPASDDFATSVPKGVTALTRYLSNQVKSCPSQKLALIGYSQGAEVVDRVTQYVLPNKNATIFNAIRSIVLLGDPQHTPGNSANVDSKGGNSTAQYSGSGLLQGGKAIPQAYNKAKKLLNICADKDSVCATSEAGSNFEAHCSYIQDAGVQKLGSKFIIAKLKA
ncbi:hypothetical protein OC846_006089 [Tilletia horrida]|uniref:Cutinase n=1 Tax=Tilletia horrida TaxID=155126 RepID=A0AAN6GMA5_9BASI|nr:hypothetical protein OC845_006349 [Tilletia horrida]KAK0544382.1 hypothetical protein OC846_006089 [Tilletia horrida]KAK0560156.1 hypothetical protein OC861_006384 [Tilletia horrida]